jgi:hypothetical protein
VLNERNSATLIGPGLGAIPRGRQGRRRAVSLPVLTLGAGGVSARQCVHEGRTFAGTSQNPLLNITWSQVVFAPRSLEEAVASREDLD